MLAKIHSVFESFMSWLFIAIGLSGIVFTVFFNGETVEKVCKWLCDGGSWQVNVVMVVSMILLSAAVTNCRIKIIRRHVKLD
jgi:hypothetical protein